MMVNTTKKILSIILATVLDGLAVRGGNAEKSDKEIDSWLSGLGY